MPSALALLERTAAELALAVQKKKQKELAPAEGRVAMAEYEREAQGFIKRMPVLKAARLAQQRPTSPSQKQSRKK